MFGKRKRKAEWLPWYRARNYKGNLTEAQKRQLDAFRLQPKHPAAEWDDLPEEVRNYLIKIDMELYDKKQEAAVAQAMFASVMGAALLFANYKGWLPTVSSFWSFVGGVLLLVVPWFWYRREWKKNAEEFLPSDHSHHPIEEGIRREWELNYNVDSHRAARNASESQASGEWKAQAQIREWEEQAQTSGKSLGDIIGEAIDTVEKGTPTERTPRQRDETVETENDQEGEAEAANWVNSKCQIATMYVAGLADPDPETRQKEKDLYLHHRNEAIKSALAIKDEFYRGFAIHQVIKLCKSARDLRTARSLFAKVSDDFLRGQILEDCPECGQPAPQ